MNANADIKDVSIRMQVHDYIPQANVMSDISPVQAISPEQCSTNQNSLSALK